MTSRYVRGVVLCSVTVLAGCSRANQAPAAVAPGLPSLAESYVRLALQLAQHDPELVDDWRGPAAWKPGPREPVAPVLRRIEALKRQLQERTPTPADADRRDYLTAQLNALHLAAERLLGRSSSFAEEARAAFGVELLPIDPRLIESTRAELEHVLPGRGSLVDRYAAFKRTLVVPPARVEATLQAALQVCRAATVREFELPSDERVDLALVSGSPWDGYARYQGAHRTRLEINRDAELDVTRALRLACHEGYPGHHVQYVWMDDALVSKRGWQEFLLTPGFGRHLLVSEGAAEAGVDALFPDAARIAVYRDTLLPAARLPSSEAARIVRIESLIARLEPLVVTIVAAYLDNDLTQATAAERLKNETLTANPVALLSFAERRRTRTLAYPEGRALVQRSIATHGVEALRRMFVDRPFAVE